jgi:hypothetical protein
VLRQLAVAAVLCFAFAVVLTAVRDDSGAEFQRGFMDGCTSKGQSVSLCECVYGKVTARHTPAELERLVKAGRFTSADLARLGRPCLAGAAPG